MIVHEVVGVEEWHILSLADNMQKEDRDSVWALTNHSPEQAIRSSVDASIESNTWLADGEVMLIYGWSRNTFLSPYICVWMLGSEELRKYPFPFLRHGKKWMKELLSEHDLMINYVDARNKRSLRWLEWLGWTVRPAVPFGIEGRMFHLVELRK